jgi:hypothetical protein
MPEDDDYGISGMEAKRFGFTVLLKEIDYQWLLRPLFFHKVFIRNMISFCNTNFFRLLNASGWIRVISLAYLDMSPLSRQVAN